MKRNLFIKTSSFFPRHHYQWLLILLTFIFIIASWSAWNELRENIKQDIHITTNNMVGFYNVSIVKDKQRDFFNININDKRGHAALFIIFPQAIKTAVLEIEVDPSVKLYRNFIYFRVLSGEKTPNNKVGGALNIKSNKWLPLRPDNHVYRIPLYRDLSKNQIILQIKHTGEINTIPIKSIKLKPATFFDYPAGAMLVCFFVIFIMFMPGMFLAMTTTLLNSLPLPIASYLYSLTTTLFALLVVKLLNNEIIFFPTVILTTIVLWSVAYLKEKNWKGTFLSLHKKNIHVLNVWCFIFVIICVILSYIYPSGVNNIHQGHITSLHTFKAFTAHDSLFQYVNAKSILENNFDKYYLDNGHKKLLYMPQDREIFPGLCYATTILFLKSFLGDTIAQSYFPYAVYFLLSHSLMCCMLFIWLKPYDLKFAYSSTFLICTAPFFWTLSMVGWFKLTGAALILAGVYVIKNEPSKIYSWIWAGILFGLAKNHHAGNALVLPILTLWVLYAAYKESKGIITLKHLGLYFSLLTTSACMLIFPWNLYVKKAWNVGTHALFSQHFLYGNFVPDSLAKSIEQFFQKVPIEEQIGTRAERVLSLFDMDRFISLYAKYEAMSTDSIAAWLKFSASFLLPSIIAYILIAILLVIFAYFTIPKNNRSPLTSDIWLEQFGIVCFINIVFLAFISYGSPKGYADVTWNFPVLLIIGMLIHILYLSCKYNRSYSTIWLYVAFFQTGLLLSYG